MSDEHTPNLNLPYLMPDQAQKHVTINDAVRRIDGLLQLSVRSMALAQPPAQAVNGMRYIVPDNADGAWQNQDGKLAIYEDTGWQFMTPRLGWRLWDEASDSFYVFADNGWQSLNVGTSSGGLPSGMNIARSRAEFDFSDALPTLNLPSHSLCLGVSGRVIETIIGPSSWQVGIGGQGGQNDKFAAGLGLSIGTQIIGPANPPFAVWQNTPIRLTPLGGNFIAGIAVIDAFYLSLSPPEIS